MSKPKIGKFETFEEMFEAVAKYEEGHNKNKLCCCGGHNASNAKANLNHHSTKQKLKYRKGKQGDNIKEIQK